MQTHVIAWRKVIVLVAFSTTLAALTASQLAAEEADAAAAAGIESDPVVKVTLPKSDLKIVERFSKIVELGTKIKAVDGFDPEVIDVTALTPNRIRVQAVAAGVTTMMLFDENDATYEVEVFVTGDVRHLQAHLKQHFPKAAVEAVAVRDSVILKGFVTQPEQITQMMEVAQQFYPQVLNQMTVGGAQQVQLKVRVLEVQRAKIRQFGFNFGYFDDGGYFASTPGTLAPLAGITPPGLTFNAVRLADSTIVGGIVRNNSVFQAFLEALKQEALLKILAEPELVTTNGRPANMLAGGEFPVLVPQSLGTTTIEWREFGVRLEAVPIILGNGRVRLELQPEVSEKDFTSSVETNGFTVPALTTRRVNTQVEMNFGETFMLAGLLQLRRSAQTDKIPFLGELPWIGAAFRRVRYEEGETELVIMVTPELVGPMKDCEVPPGGPGLNTSTPTDRELYIDGFIEVPNYGGECPNCGPNYCPDGSGLNGAGMSPTPVENVPGADPSMMPNGTEVPPAPTTPSVTPMPVPPSPVAPAPAPPATSQNTRGMSTQMKNYSQAFNQPKANETTMQKLARNTKKLNPFAKKVEQVSHEEIPVPTRKSTTQSSQSAGAAQSGDASSGQSLQFRSEPAESSGLIAPRSGYAAP
jgi:pilus assembly protein CpaC